MKRIVIFIFSLFIFNLLSFNLSAQQYGPQFDNSGFEQWTTRNENSVSEPVHWHSSGTATGSFSGFLSSQIAESSHCRYGSSGTKSVRIFPTSVLGVTANGTLTNGRMNAGSMSATGANNYNYTQRANSAFNTPITQLPDSLTIWVCFRSASTTDHAQVKAVVHGDADYEIRANGTEGPNDMHVATAEQSFTRTAPANGNYTWTRLSIPFVNSGPCTDVRYILFMATTNENPGQGDTSDDLFVDDALLIYNPTLTLGQLPSTQWTTGSSVTLPFTLTGTMSPDNLNASANQVIAQLSDADGSFSNPTDLGSVTTNTSGSITTQVPNVTGGQYQIRVISTNYPLIGQNIQTVSISSPTYTITATANPSDGGTVTGSGTYQQGQNCTVSATPNTNYTFTNWTENGSVVSTDASYTFTVNGDRSLVANFTYTPPTYTVNVSANPNNGGAVTGGGTYQEGQTCTVLASANTGYAFINWTENGNQVSSQTSYTFTVTGNRNLVANFSTQSYIITAIADPEEGGVITGSGGYNYGDVCTLTATANTGYSFINWIKDGIQLTTSPTLSFTVTESATYTAHFAVNSYTINVKANPEEGGTVNGDGTYSHGQSCTISATPNENYEFINWTKDDIEVSTESSFTFTVAESATFVAHFRYYDKVDENIATSQIYPNPFASTVSIKAEKVVKNVSVYDVFGRLVKVQNVSNTVIDLDLSDLNDGTYLLQLNYGDCRSTHRIVKMER